MNYLIESSCRNSEKAMDVEKFTRENQLKLLTTEWSDTVNRIKEERLRVGFGGAPVKR